VAQNVTVNTYTVQIVMSGSIEEAKSYLRERCLPPNPGLCVTVTPTHFIYAGGEETGFVVGLVNYPRFPNTPQELWDYATAIADALIIRTKQWSALVIAPDKSQWMNVRPEGQR
jgi:hypothetical protein